MKASLFLSDTEIQQLLDGINTVYPSDKVPRANAKLRLMTFLMLDCALRVGELVQLRLSHLLEYNKARQFIDLPGSICKGKHPRQVPLSHRARCSIDVFVSILNNGDPVDLDSFVFFVSDPSRSQTTRSIQLSYYRLCPKIGLRLIHPHMLRHSGANRMMKVCNVREVQMFLGHKHLSSTQIYLHPVLEDLKKGMDKLGV